MENACTVQTNKRDASVFYTTDDKCSYCFIVEPLAVLKEDYVKLNSNFPYFLQT